MSGGRNQKLHLPYWSVEKLSSMKLVSGAKEVADCCSNIWNQCQLLKNTSFWITETFYPVLGSWCQWEWCQTHLRYQIHMPSGHCLELNPKTKSSDVFLSNSGLGAAGLYWMGGSHSSRQPWPSGRHHFLCLNWIRHRPSGCWTPTKWREL